MCALMPRSLETMAEITGIGERKLDKYGPDFLAVIDKHLAGT
jgi:superfamily II DNA helicase RecQ